MESRQFLFPNTFFLSLQRNINLEKDFVISNSKFYCCESNIKEFSSLQKKNCIKNWIISLWISSRKRERERETFIKIKIKSIKTVLRTLFEHCSNLVFTGNYKCNWLANLFEKFVYLSFHRNIINRSIVRKILK